MEKISTQEQKSIPEDKKEFNLLSSVMHQVDNPKAQEPHTHDTYTNVSDEQEVAETEPTPEELYKDSVRALEKVWIALTGQEKLIPVARDDVTIHHIKPTRVLRKQMVKGINERQRAHLYNCLVWVEAAIHDTLNIADEIKWE